MNSNLISKSILVVLVCFCVSCSKEEGAPKCGDEIPLAGVRAALYKSIARGGNRRVFDTSIEIDNIRTVKKDKEERECSAWLFILRKYQIPFYYTIAADETGEYYVTLFGIDDGTKDNVYKVINHMQPRLIGEYDTLPRCRIKKRPQHSIGVGAFLGFSVVLHKTPRESAIPQAADIF